MGQEELLEWNGQKSFFFGKNSGIFHRNNMKIWLNDFLSYKVSWINTSSVICVKITFLSLQRALPGFSMLISNEP